MSPSQVVETKDTTGRSRSRLVILLAAVPSVAFLGAVLFHQAFLQHNDAEPESVYLAISLEELDLGRVWEASAREHRFHITNTTDQPITIARFEKSCDCLGITPASNVTLQPHEPTPFQITFPVASRLASANSGGGQQVGGRFHRDLLGGWSGTEDGLGAHRGHRSHDPVSEGKS